MIFLSQKRVARPAILSAMQSIMSSLNDVIVDTRTIITDNVIAMVTKLDPETPLSEQPISIVDRQLKETVIQVVTVDGMTGYTGSGLVMEVRAI